MVSSTFHSFLTLLQYDNEIAHYGSTTMDGHSASMYDPHRSMQQHSLSHSPGIGNHTSALAAGMHSQFPSYSTSSSSSMQGVMNSSPVDSQVKRDKDLIYG